MARQPPWQTFHYRLLRVKWFACLVRQDAENQQLYGSPLVLNSRIGAASRLMGSLFRTQNGINRRSGALSG
jgi:hypothetical protein